MSQYTTEAEVLNALAAGTLTVAAALPLIEAMKAAAVSSKGSTKAFKVTLNEEKGGFNVTLPGHGMAIFLSTEGLTAIVDNVEALTEQLLANGTRLAAKRAAYRQTDAYKASAAKMYSVATEAKRKHAA